MPSPLELMHPSVQEAFDYLSENEKWQIEVEEELLTESTINTSRVGNLIDFLKHELVIAGLPVELVPVFYEVEEKTEPTTETKNDAVEMGEQEYVGMVATIIASLDRYIDQLLIRESRCNTPERLLQYIQNEPLDYEDLSAVLYRTEIFYTEQGWHELLIKKGSTIENFVRKVWRTIETEFTGKDIEVDEFSWVEKAKELALASK